MGAQFHLGKMYAAGSGVGRDYVQAYLWFDLSTSDGNSIGAENRDTVARLMTAAQIDEARRLIRDWKAAKTEELAADK